MTAIFPESNLIARSSNDSKPGLPDDLAISLTDAIARQPVDITVDGKSHTHARIPGLDGLRGLAIVAVLFLHLSYATDEHIHAGIFSALFRAFHLGWVGVDFFFVISGFLITGILLDTKDSPRYFRDFYARRTLRIFPLYYGVLFLTLIAAPALSLLPWPMAPGWLWSYLYNIPLTFETRGMVAPSQAGVNFIHFWSLAVEEQFYLIWPLVVFLVSKRSLKWIAIGGIALSIAMRIALAFVVSREDTQFLLIARLDGLCCGALLALGVRSAGGIPRTVKLASLALVGMLPVVIATYLLRHYYQVEGDDKIIKFTFVVVAFSALLAFTLNSGDKGRLTRIIGNPVLRFFGKYSYGLYVYHMLLLPQFIRFFGPEKLAGPEHIVVGDLLFMLIAAAVSIVMAVISFHVFEAPILSLKRYFSYRAA